MKPKLFEWSAFGCTLTAVTCFACWLVLYLSTDTEIAMAAGGVSIVGREGNLFITNMTDYGFENFDAVDAGTVIPIPWRQINYRGPGVGFRLAQWGAEPQWFGWITLLIPAGVSLIAAVICYFLVGKHSKDKSPPMKSQQSTVQ